MEPKNLVVSAELDEPEPKYKVDTRKIVLRKYPLLIISPLFPSQQIRGELF